MKALDALRRIHVRLTTPAPPPQRRSPGSYVGEPYLAPLEDPCSNDAP